MKKNKIAVINTEMLPPICYFTTSFNRVLFCFITYIFKHFAFILGVYIFTVILVNIPWININSIYIILVSFSPILLPCALLVGYVGMGLILLALFAKDPRTRIGCAVIIETIFIVPWLLITLLDTRLFLILGDFFAFSLLIGNILLMTWLGMRYKKDLYKETWVHKAHFCPHLLTIMLIFTGFESSQGFSYTQINQEHFTTHNFQLVVPKDKNGHPRGKPYYVCDVLLDYNGYTHTFRSMKIPNGLKPSIQYLELRQAFFQHFNLR
ncbi:hypothetical protein [Marinomonas sp.]|uniref:hypothetical protein n=1 Tax=Marinomonas sp. TaxID=1904862 RepID=UPI003BAAE67D